MLESFYEVERARIAELLGAVLLAVDLDAPSARDVLRAREVYEIDRLDFAEAYLVASAEASGIDAGRVVRSLDRPHQDRAAHRASLARQRRLSTAVTPADATGINPGNKLSATERQLSATRTRSRPLSPLPRNQILPAGGRAVAGSNPVSPIDTESLQMQAFCVSDSSSPSALEV